jgi:hypothetical protein
VIKMDHQPPKQPGDVVQSSLDELRRKRAEAPRPVWRGAALIVAALLALAVGALYLWQWTLGLRGPDLLRFVSLYLCLPMGLSLLLLFAALQKK